MAGQENTAEPRMTPEELGNLWRPQEMEETAGKRTIEKLLALYKRQGRRIIGAESEEHTA